MVDYQVKKAKLAPVRIYVQQTRDHLLVRFRQNYHRFGQQWYNNIVRSTEHSNFQAASDCVAHADSQQIRSSID
jgi:hypothetical protein